MPGESAALMVEKIKWSCGVVATNIGLQCFVMNLSLGLENRSTNATPLEARTYRATLLVLLVHGFLKLSIQRRTLRITSWHHLRGVQAA